MWTIIGQIILSLVKFTASRADRKEKAEQAFMKIVKRMDELAAQNADLKIKYDQLRKTLGDTPPKEPGI